MKRFLYLANDSAFWVMIPLILVILPHLSRMPAWTLFFLPLLFFWRLAAVNKLSRLPKKWLLFIIVVLSSLGILFHYGTLFGKTAGTAFLSLLLAIKLLESSKRRDYMLLIALSFFIIVTNFLFTQDIPTVIYMLVTVVILVMTLIFVNQESAPLNLQQRFKMSLKVVLQALPLMLVMFVLFPRIPGPLWKLPEERTTATTGLSDSMTPGNISQLIQSNEVSFRVEFKDDRPAQNQLYWRAHVLWDFDGRAWEAGDINLNPLPYLEIIDNPVEYTATLEPHHKNWLFALDMPAEIPEQSTYDNNFLLRAKQPVNTLYQYSALSYLNYRIETQLSIWERRAGLKLPVNQNPRTLDLAQQLKQRYLDPVDIVSHALKTFNQEEFIYTLYPPLTPGFNTVDQFLFETRRGFCEHYASSFAVLMRAAGIPARIILGYQGGVFNPVNNVLTVRQSDAHAWTEVWLKNQGWVRVDPTAAIAPERIEQNLNAALPENESRPLFMHLDRGLLKDLRFYWDALDNKWNQWVIGYGPEIQKEFLSALMNKDIDYEEIIYLLVISLTSVSLLVILFILKPFKRSIKEPVQLAYDRFCLKLARKGVSRELHEGPVTFSQRAIRNFPEHENTIKLVTAIYINLKYRSRDNAEQLSKMKLLTRQLKI